MSSRKRKRSDNPWQSLSAKRQDIRENFSLKKFADISTAYDYLRSLFPSDKFDDRIPSIVWRHQLYAICDNRTQVDKQLTKWCETGYVRLFRLGSTVNSNDVVVVLMRDFKEFFDKKCTKTVITERFINKVIVQKWSTQISLEELKDEFQYNEDNITELIRSGLLARHRNVGIFLLSIPNAGEFIKSFDSSKKSIVSMISKSKYKEITKSNLLNKRFSKDMKFSIEYHVYDLIGSDLIHCVETPTDTILRMA